MFLFMYIISFFIVMSTNDWFIVWLGLEINMMMFIMIMYKQIKLLTIEACLKYFFVQSLSSALLISFLYLGSEYFEYYSSMVLSMKLGAGPFFFWFPSVCDSLGWFSCFLIMSFQKILPFLLISMVLSWLIWMILLFSMMIGMFGSFFQIRMKMLLAYSSIHHMGWMFMCIMIDKILWMYYLFVYMILLFSVVLILSKFEINYFMLEGSQVSSWWLVFSMLSMSGMPPMLGFFLKWIMFYYIMNISWVLLMFMVLISVFMFYVYFRIAYMIILMYSIIISWESSKNDEFNSYFMSWAVVSVVFGMIVILLLI